MDDVTDALPFAEQRGRIYIAPLGADPPRHYVASDPPGSAPRFVDEWPAAWILGGETDPGQCREQYDIDTERVSVDGLIEPIGYVTSRSAQWAFGLDQLATGRVPWSSLPPLPEGQVPWAPRFMLGWESLDRRSRVVARQVVHDLGTMHRPSRSSALFLTYRLEQAEKPLPPFPARPLWRRLLDRLLRRRPPARTPDLYPPFEIYRVGVRPVAT
jgi:hypothetical protein